MGGWPTIKYFNKDTGYEGAPYEKKENNAMCDELGKDANMEAYVMSAAQTSLCDIKDPANCSEKEIAYVEKHKESDKNKLSIELSRLAGLKGGKLTATAASWLNQRISILRQYNSLQEEL